MKNVILVFVTICQLNLMGRTQDIFHVDIELRANVLMDSNLGRGIEGNHLKELPQKELKTDSSRFQVAKGLLHLGSKVLVKFPDKIEGIQVNKTASKLQFLHATCFGGGTNKSAADPLFVKDGEKVGAYVIVYDDESKAEIPLIYGENIRDFWFRENELPPSHAKVAWSGQNPWAKSNGCKIRLYELVWVNPKPDLLISEIEFVGTNKTSIAAPFCVAISGTPKQR